MGGKRAARKVAALDLVGALGPGFDPFQAVRDGIVDGLIIAGFEMQKFVVGDAAPVAAIERVPVE